MQTATSIGLALTGAAFPPPDALLHAADAALYRTKRLGRGRTEIAATDDLAWLDVRFV